MARIILVLLLIILHLTACQMKETTLPSALEFTQELTNTSTRAAATATFVTSPTSTIFFPNASTPPTSTHISTPTELPTDTPTKTSSFTIHPVIHEQPGELYETVFSIPVGSGNIIQYSGGCCTTLIGPNALAVLPDLSFLIADYLGTRIRILHYDHNGRLLNTLYMDDLGIKMIRDLRTRGNQVFLLETSYENYWVHQISLDGELFASQKIPHLYQVGGKDYTLESILTGIAIDCEENILLEAGGDQYRLTDIQTQSNLENVTKGYFCNGKRYQVINPGPGKTPNIIAGDIIYETQTTMGLGGFQHHGSIPGRQYLCRP